MVDLHKEGGYNQGSLARTLPAVVSDQNKTFSNTHRLRAAIEQQIGLSEVKLLFIFLDRTRCRSSLLALLVFVCPAFTDKQRADEKIRRPRQHDAKMKSLFSSPTRPSSLVYCQRWDCAVKSLPKVYANETPHFSLRFCSPLLPL